MDVPAPIPMPVLPAVVFTNADDATNTRQEFPTFPTWPRSEAAHYRIDHRDDSSNRSRVGRPWKVSCRFGPS
jgi:hypothetical protein